jgi:hypothetical protein
VKVTLAAAWLLLASCGRHDTPVARYRVPVDAQPFAGTDAGGNTDSGVAGVAGDTGAASGAEAGGAAGAPAELSCPAAYTISIPGSVSRYRYATSGNGWVEAERDCESEGQHLVVISDAAENAWVASLAAEAVTDAASTNQLVWVGAGDSRAEGSFDWVTGEAVSLSFWSSAGEPNSLYDDEDCVEIRGSGSWNDDRCNAPLTYVCECDGAVSAALWCDTSADQLRRLHDVLRRRQNLHETGLPLATGTSAGPDLKGRRT